MWSVFWGFFISSFFTYTLLFLYTHTPDANFAKNDCGISAQNQAFAIMIPILKRYIACAHVNRTTLSDITALYAPRILLSFLRDMKYKKTSLLICRWVSSCVLQYSITWLYRAALECSGSINTQVIRASVLPRVGSCLSHDVA